MTRRATAWVVVAAMGALAGAAAAAPPARARPGQSVVHAQDRGDEPGRPQRGRRSPDPTGLWSLYPLDPEAAETPVPRLEESADEGLQQGELTEGDRLQEPVGGSALTPEDSGGAPGEVVVVLGGVAVLATIGAGWMLAARRSKLPAPATQSVRLGTSPAAGARAAPPPEVPGIVREHVRVHLSDGRSVEGWKRGSFTQEHRVLVLDVDDVFDASGTKVPSTPLDSFLLPPQIRRIELVDDPAVSSQDAPG